MKLTMNILKHSMHKAIYDLCLEIEKLPASEQQTKVVQMAVDLHTGVDKLIDALRDAVSVFTDGKSCVTGDRLEAWEAVAEALEKGK